MLPLLTGQTTKDPREEFFYINDDAQLVSLRYDNWKMVFQEQRQKGTMMIWAEPFVALRAPKIFNLRTDPFEMADVTSNSYWDWIFDHAFLYVPAQASVGKFLISFKDFPPRQKPGSFNLDEVLRKMSENHGSK
jgi:arylsulfatase